MGRHRKLLAVLALGAVAATAAFADAGARLGEVLAAAGAAEWGTGDARDGDAVIFWEEGEGCTVFYAARPGGQKKGTRQKAKVPKRMPIL